MTKRKIPEEYNPLIVSFDDSTEGKMAVMNNIVVVQVGQSQKAWCSSNVTNFFTKTCLFEVPPLSTICNYDKARGHLDVCVKTQIEASGRVILETAPEISKHTQANDLFINAAFQSNLRKVATKFTINQLFETRRQHEFDDPCGDEQLEDIELGRQEADPAAYDVGGATLDGPSAPDVGDHVALEEVLHSSSWPGLSVPAGPGPSSAPSGRRLSAEALSNLSLEKQVNIIAEAASMITHRQIISSYEKTGMWLPTDGSEDHKLSSGLKEVLRKASQTIIPSADLEQEALAAKKDLANDEDNDDESDIFEVSKLFEERRNMVLRKQIIDDRKTVKTLKVKGTDKCFQCSYCGKTYASYYSVAARSHDFEREGRCPKQSLESEGIFVPTKDELESKDIFFRIRDVEPREVIEIDDIDISEDFMVDLNIEIAEKI